MVIAFRFIGIGFSSSKYTWNHFHLMNYMAWTKPQRIQFANCELKTANMFNLKFIFLINMKSANLGNSRRLWTCWTTTYHVNILYYIIYWLANLNVRTVWLSSSFFRRYSVEARVRHSKSSVCAFLLLLAGFIHRMHTHVRLSVLLFVSAWKQTFRYAWIRSYIFVW